MTNESEIGIAAVERETGLSKDTLRVWERRYGFPRPLRDANGERALARALLRAKERQITVVTITQRAALLMSVDKIMIMHQGAVQAFGSRDEIIPMIGGGRKPNNVPPGPDDPPALN